MFSMWIRCFHSKWQWLCHFNLFLNPVLTPNTPRLHSAPASLSELDRSQKASKHMEEGHKTRGNDTLHVQEMKSRSLSTCGFVFSKMLNCRLSDVWLAFSTLIKPPRVTSRFLLPKLGLKWLFSLVFRELTASPCRRRPVSRLKTRSSWMSKQIVGASERLRVVCLPVCFLSIFHLPTSKGEAGKGPQLCTN